MKRLLISMLGLLTIVSCVKNEIAQGLTYENDPKSVYVSADMLSTKATIGDTFEYGDRFAIKSLSTNIAESYRFAEYRYNNEIWERISGQYMHWDSGNNSFQAWYPSSASYDSFTLPTDQSNFDRLCSADWMTAEVENIKQTSDNKIDLHFRHRLAIIRVVITSDSYMSTCKFYTSDKREILSYIDSYFPYKESCAIVLLTPGQYSEGSTFMTITKDDYEIDVKVPSGGLILEEGKSYNFTLSITEKNAQIADVVINDWNTSVLDQVIVIEEFSGVKIPDNEIWYVTTDGSIHSPGYISEYGDYYFRYGSGAFTPFDAEIVSNTYENGKGVIKFSSTVTYINYYAFEGTRIKEIYLPDSIQNLDFYSISNTGIKTFRVPANINHSVNQFCSNRNLESFTGSFVSEDGRCLIIDNKLTTFAPKDIDIYNTPSGVEVIGVYAFANNSELEQITISEGVREIEHSAFEDCSKLKKIFFPSTLIKIEYNFWKCTELEGFYGNETFHTPDNKGLIYKDSKGFTHMSQFAGKGITEYTIPDGIYSVSFSYYAKDLKSVTFPNSVKEVSANSFDGCDNLEAIYGDNTSEDHRCFVVDNDLKLVIGKGLSEYRIPDNVHRISSRAFFEGSEIDSISMGDQVTIIDYDAFYNCENLKTLTLSARLEYIELGTILNHSNNRSQNIESIYLRAPIPPEIDNIDRNINASDLRIYVPSESVESYKSSRGWSDLKDYIYAYDYTDLPEINGYYYSTDYSRDGQLTIVQTATDGDGIDLIFMGKAFSDRQIADGTYSNAMQQGIDAFFSQEPFKSFKNLFNIYIIDAVSYSEKYIDDPIIDYTWPIDHLNKAFPKLDFNIVDSNIIIIINTPKDTEITAQTSGPISYVPLCDDTALFNKQILHEAGGHGFAKLADEDFDEHNEFPPIGTYDSYLFESDNKNIDITNDPNTIKWSHFLNDERYSSDGVGIYEGAIGYSKGVYRPSENSIMRNYTGGFNAPSREAIYYQIHRLAYGRNWEYNWEYNYEDFVEYDAINRGKQNQE